MSVKYYRSKIAGLSVVTDHDVAYSDGEVAHPTETFTPYYERLDGDQIKVGYLSTDNEVAQRKLKSDFNVEEVNKDEFERATDEKNTKVRRAPF